MSIRKIKLSMKNYFKKATSSGEEMHIKITMIENKEIQNTDNVFN